MKIDFNKKEYMALLDILEIAEWVINAHKIDTQNKETVYSKLEQKIYSYAKEMGFEELIEYDDNLKSYFPTRMFEENSPAHQFIDEYDNEIFWEELIERLVERDLIDQLGVERFRIMSPVERIKKEAPLRSKYGTEFEKNGIENLRVD